MMWETLGTVRDLGRLQEIAVVLIRYGFGDVVRRIGLATTLERAGRLLHWNEDRQELLRMTAPVRVRSAMQDLGPTFVKLGQVLATRVDLLPPEWIAELSELQNAVLSPAVRRDPRAARSRPGRVAAWRYSPSLMKPRWPPRRWRRPIAPGCMMVVRWC